MRHLVAFTILLLFQLSSHGHDHNLSTFTIYQNAGAWLIKIDFPTSTLLSSLNEKYRSDSISEQEMKEEIIRYFKTHIELITDSTAVVQLGEGGIKYGTHSSEVVFILKGYEPNWATMACHISAFQENDEQNNLLRVNIDESTYKVFLNSKNNFSTTLDRVQISF
jgi:hypothetical protein